MQTMIENNQKRADIDSLLLAQKRTLNVEELSRFTGFSKSFIYKLTSTKKIPHSCPNGKLLVFDRVLIESWLLSNPVDLSNDVEQEAINYVTAKPWKGEKL
jgi:predicted DNA-binding transcriptional regulator AlpA